MGIICISIYFFLSTYFFRFSVACLTVGFEEKGRVGGGGGEQGGRACKIVAKRFRVNHPLILFTSVS